MVEREKFCSWLMGKKQRWGKSSVTEEAPPLTSMNAARRGAQCSRRGNLRGCRQAQAWNRGTSRACGWARLRGTVGDLKGMPRRSSR